MHASPTDNWTPDESEVEDIVAELPTLVALRDFASGLARVAWFKRVGEPPDREEMRLALAYCDALGFPHAHIAAVGDWQAALDCAENLDWDAPAWEAEEQLRATLYGVLLEQVREEALTVALTRVAAEAGHALKDRMAEVAALWDIADRPALDVAAGAAAQSAHQLALAHAAKADADHPFRHKFDLFGRGRWPIGIVGSSFNLF